MKKIHTYFLLLLLTLCSAFPAKAWCDGLLPCEIPPKPPAETPSAPEPSTQPDSPGNSGSSDEMPDLSDEANEIREENSTSGKQLEEAENETNAADSLDDTVPNLDTPAYGQMLMDVLQKEQEAERMLAEATNRTQIRQAENLKAQAAAEKKKILDAAGDPVLLYTGEYAESITDMTVTANTLLFPVLRSYNTNNTISGSYGYGWVSSLDQRIILGGTPDTDVLLAQYRNRVTTIEAQTARLKQQFKASYGCDYYSDVAGTLRAHQNTAATVYGMSTRTTAKVSSLRFNAQSLQLRLEQVKSKTAALTAISSRKQSDYAAALQSYQSDIAAILAQEQVLSRAKTALASAERDFSTQKAVLQENSATLFPGTPDYWYQIGYGNLVLISDSGIPCLFQKVSEGQWSNGKGAVLKKTREGYECMLRDGTAQVYNQQGFLIKITDRNNNWISITRSQSTQQPDEISTSNGESFQVQWTAAGYITAITSNRTSYPLVQYTYSDTLLCQVADADEFITRYEYNRQRVLTGTKKADGSAITQTLERTKEGTFRVVATIDEEGHSEHFAYDSSNSSSTYTNHDGTSIRVYFDAAGHIIRKESPESGITLYTFSETGLPTSVSDAKGITQFQYNAYGDLSKVRYPDGSCETMQYDEYGQILRQILTTGEIQQFQRDSRGNIVHYSSSLGHSQLFTWNAAGLLQSMTITNTGGLSEKRTYSWDQWGNLLKETKGDTTTSYTYDGRNRILSIAINGKETERRKYTDRTVTIENDTGLKTIISVDDRKDIISVERLDTVTREIRHSMYKYDRRHNPIRETLNDVVLSDCRYTAEGMPLARIIYDTEQSLVTLWEWKNSTLAGITRFSVTGKENKALLYGDASWQTVSLEYLMDCARKRNELTRFEVCPLSENESESNGASKTSKSGSTLTTDYFDERGRIIRREIGKDFLEEYIYSSDNRQVTRIQGGKYTTEYSLNGFGEIIAVTDGNRNITRYTTDSQGRKTSTTLPSGDTIRYTHNGPGFLTSIVSPDGYETTFRYDINGNVIQESGPGGIRWKGTWNTAGKLLNETEYPGIEKKWTWDDKGNLVHAEWAGVSVDVSRLFTGTVPQIPKDAHFTYNDLGNITSASTADSQLLFTWDTGGKLTMVNDVRNDRTITYGYDSAGRMIRKKVMQNKTTLSERTYTYDANGNCTRIQDLTQKTSINCTYDNCNRETSRSYTDGTRYQTRYDESGRTVVQWVSDSKGEVLWCQAYVYSTESGRCIATANHRGEVTLYEFTEQGYISRILFTVTAEQADTIRQQAVRNGWTGDKKTVKGFLHPLPLPLVESLKKALNTAHLTLGNVIHSTPCLSSIEYRYDSQGNRLSEITEYGTIVHTYNEKDQLLYSGMEQCPLFTSRTWDESGNVIREVSGSTVKEYTYTSENRLKTCTTEDKTTGERHFCSYSYDALGRRSTICQNGNETQFIYDGVTFAIIGTVSHEDTSTAQYRYRWLGAEAQPAVYQNRIYVNGTVAAETEAGRFRNITCDTYGSPRLLHESRGTAATSRYYNVFGVPLSY